MLEQVENVVLHETARERYLNYALSVITARALPDVRDGLKPVQRRILYAMYQGLRLLPDAKPRKSAAVVGEVMAKYHPHGDQSIYDAMVRMAQHFSLRYPLVEGQGNFGSLDGDPAAAMRYTELRLRHVAVELGSELGKRTVDYRPNYDGTLFEPEVLPAQFPNLLVNGAAGIAVGMATNIPPHNLGEVVDAAVALIDDPSLALGDLVGPVVQGPDFPTGPTILADRATLLEIYETGQGSVTMRGDYHLEGRLIVVTTLPHGVNKSSLISDIAEHIRAENVPQLVDVRDESTDDIRVVLELRRGADPEAAMAFLYKRTALEARFAVNMNALCPTGEEGAPCQPRRLGLLEILRQFLDFRLNVTRRRLEYDLEQLEKRIHLLRAFEIIFSALDEALRIIRGAQDKGSAREGLMDRFGLDHDQAEAVLETKLFKLAQLEIDGVRRELAEKEAEAKGIRETLASEARLWGLVRQELVEIRGAYGDRRRCRVTAEQAEELEFNPEDYIVAEDAFVMISRHGRLKRQKSYTELGAVRVPEGDELGWVMPSSTTETLILFTDRGKAYSMRVADVPATTGYGEPVQARFDFGDGEHIVGAIASDARCLPKIAPEQLAEVGEEDPQPPYAVAVSKGGRCLRFSLDGYVEPSTRAGRLFMRLEPKLAIDGVAAVHVSDGTELVSLATHDGRVLLFDVGEIKVLGGPGKGVQAIKLDGNDHVLGWVLTADKMDGLTVETNRGRVEVVRPNKYQVTRRGNRGREIIKRGFLARVEIPPVEIALPSEDEEAEEAGGEEVAEGLSSTGDAGGEGPTPDDAAPGAARLAPAAKKLNGHARHPVAVPPGQGSLFDDDDDDSDPDLE